jgi:hypothetical protein
MPIKIVVVLCYLKVYTKGTKKGCPRAANNCRIDGLVVLGGWFSIY